VVRLISYWVVGNLWVFIIAFNNVHAQSNALDLEGCRQAVVQTLTHNLPMETPDPAPPLWVWDPLTGAYKVQVFISGSVYLEWSSLRDFRLGLEPQIKPLELFYSNGLPIGANGIPPAWDARAFQILRNGRPAQTIHLAGAMSRSPDGQLPRGWEDNADRRVYLFVNGKQVPLPLTGDSPYGWLGHNYGGNLIQKGESSNTIDLDSKEPIYLFSERVTEVRDGKPYLTEMVSVRLKPIFDQKNEFVAFASEGEMKPLLKKDSAFYEASKRDAKIGGYLVEGPRPVEVMVEGERYFVVGFSSSEYSSDSYRAHFAFSKNIEGPYQVIREVSGAYKDFGRTMKEGGASWVGRPVLYQDIETGKWAMMWHQVDRAKYPGHDFSRVPDGQFLRVEDFRRYLKRAMGIQFVLTENGLEIIGF